MTEEEYIRNRNSVYGLIIDTEITNKVRNHIKELEENTMNATSVQKIENVRNISFIVVENDPIEKKHKMSIVAGTNDDIFEFDFEGPELIQQCKAAGLFTGWEKDQEIRELEKKLSEWKKEAAECLVLRDEAQKEAYKLKKENEKLKELKTPTIENFSDEEPADNVNHPSHYTGKYECIDVMQDVFGDNATDNFCLCNAFKYIWRARKKNGLEDVKKAIWYLNKYLELTEKEV